MSGVWVEPEPGLAPRLWPWPGWALTWFAQAKPPGHGKAQSFHTKEEIVFDASRAATAHEVSNPSVRKLKKGFVFGGSARACGHENFPLFRQ